jgi:hypothetical protein
MGPQTWIFSRRARLAGAATVVMVALSILVGARPAAAQAGCTRVMGQSTATAAQLAGWFATTARTPKLDVTVAALATMFVEEGAREGVRGDLAFAQSIVETGYFGFSPSVPPDYHNYSGLGATGGGVKGAGFPDARTGVRAQIQHLRAYADPSLRSAADLKAPLVDPRFKYLVPNERTVPCWEQFGSGVWAADPTGYGPRVIGVHQRISAFRVPVAAVAAPAPAPVAPDAQAAAVPVAPEPAAAVVAPEVAVAVAPAASLDGEALAADLGGAPALAVEAPAFLITEPSSTELDARAASSSGRASAGGALGGLAVVCVGFCLLTICSTLWWHGRRFARLA